MMKTKTTFSLLAIAGLALSGVAFAGGKTYQATGQVVKVSAAMVVIQSGTQKWEIARDTNTKVKGDLKKGDTVTVTYTMNATAVDVKVAPATSASAAAQAAPVKKAAAPAKLMKATAPATSSAVGDPDAQKKEEPNAQKKEQPNATATPTPDE
jgi:cytochrome bd-type quinol oxidase subunit 1